MAHRFRVRPGAFRSDGEGGVSEVPSRLTKTADVYEAGDSRGKDAADRVACGMPGS